MTLPLAHHDLVAALPVFAPAVVLILGLVIFHLRERRHWDEDGDTE